MVKSAVVFSEDLSLVCSPQTGWLATSYNACCRRSNVLCSLSINSFMHVPGMQTCHIHTSK